MIVFFLLNLLFILVKFHINILILSFLTISSVLVIITFYIIRKKKYNIFVINGSLKFKDNIILLNTFRFLIFLWIIIIEIQFRLDINHPFSFISFSFSLFIYYLINKFCVINKKLFLENQMIQWIVIIAFIINWMCVIFLLNIQILNAFYILILSISVILFLILLFVLNYINDYNSNLFYYFMILLSIVNAYVNLSDLFYIYFIWYAIVTLFIIITSKKNENNIPILKSSKYTLMYYIYCFIYDCKVIKYHLLKEFQLIVALRQLMVAIFFMFLIIKRANIKCIDWNLYISEYSCIFYGLYFIFFGFLLLVICIRHFIICFCNPFSHLTTLNKCVGICSAFAGGGLIIRDSALNSENPIFIPYVTQAIQMRHWGYCCLDYEDHRSRNNWNEVYKTKAIPTRDVKSVFGNYKRICKDTIKCTIEADNASKNSSWFTFFWKK